MKKRLVSPLRRLMRNSDRDLPRASYRKISIPHPLDDVRSTTLPVHLLG